MNPVIPQLKTFIVNMRAAFARGENTMEYARRELGEAINLPVATLIAYDLQAGSYVDLARANPANNDRWCQQLSKLIAPHLVDSGSMLEVGCGEATTLAGVIKHLPVKPSAAYGFDISWSRCSVGSSWLKEKEGAATLFVSDLFAIPLEDNSIDVVYTSHSLEPNGGREEEALRELLRIAKRAVVLIEPIFELASPEAQQRMSHHGYVKNLKKTAENLGVEVSEYRLLDYISNSLNPSGSLVLEKNRDPVPAVTRWRCPMTHSPLQPQNDVYFTEQTGLAYPVLRGIPLLRTEHAVVASKLS
jgi:ubiquinone/menaquinone biosynthesis C-methylase UbiE